MEDVVVVVKTWQGISEGIARNRLESLAHVLPGIERYLLCSNYSWHVADDGSAPWFVDAVRNLMGTRRYTFTSSGANGDIGRNINLALGEVFQRTDVVLNWSDDLVLLEKMDIDPYVALLRGYDDVGYVMTRAVHPSLNLIRFERDGRVWHEIDKESDTPFLIVTSLQLMHRRAWDFYGPYPEGLRIDIMQEEMRWRFRRFRGGPMIVVPEELVKGERQASVGKSTWNWRIEEARAHPAWHRYRCYSVRAEYD